MEYRHLSYCTDMDTLGMYKKTSIIESNTWALQEVE